MKNLFLILFIGVGVGELVSILFNVEVIHFISKPLIMLTLGFFYTQSVGREKRSVALLLAIIFSWLGDVLLMFAGKNDHYFMMGLAAFLVAHIFYILAYRVHRADTPENGLQGVQRIRFAFPIILAGTGLMVVLFPVLGDLKFPVGIYALVMMIMVLNALFRYGYTNGKSFWMVFLGATLFMISDSTLAINKFLHPVQYGIFLTMSSYILAQYCIVKGLIIHSEKN
jgi:uncharacterized membrane protein YhhN